MPMKAVPNTQTRTWRGPSTYGSIKGFIAVSLVIYFFFSLSFSPQPSLAKPKKNTQAMLFKLSSISSLVVVFAVVTASTDAYQLWYKNKGSDHIHKKNIAGSKANKSGVFFFLFYLTWNVCGVSILTARQNLFLTLSN